MRQHLVAVGSGIVFAVGLGIAGMTRPEKVIGFLDFGGQWDASLALVMVGAIGINAAVWWGVARHRKKPAFGDVFALPTARAIDWRLVVGAVVFGLGWGLGGYCPGPAVSSMLVAGPSALVFVAAMLGGVWVAKRI
ncbi:MAG: YeeE/YedE family protein [Myxococcales bacterium]|nr:YeeE/YedE family protein [Myxococcales bacterium]